MPTLTQNPVILSEVVDLAARGLERMFDAEQQQFCHTLRRSPDGMQRRGLSPRYTLMTLLGWHRLESSAAETRKAPWSVASVLHGLTQDLSWISGAGDLGLLLWAVGEIVPGHFAEVAEKAAAFNALTRYPDAARGCTMELAWYLTGLTCGLQAAEQNAATQNATTEDARLEEQARQTVLRLIENQGTSGIFGHQARGKSLAGALRGKIGSFADQVYPIYALSRFVRLTGDQQLLQRALQCARTICQRQGPNGEWWWHYDASSGEVTETYPVYSVHQDGMAPMALFALQEAAGEDFTGPIGNGLEWIAGQNDLQLDMRDPAESVIWRNLELPRTERLLRHLAGSDNGAWRAPVERLRVNFECRPYELGWALYALAGR